MGRVTHIVNQGPGTRGTDPRLSMAAAIDRYTSGPAYASFDEKEKGTLAFGMLADLVVMATALFANPPASRADRVHATRSLVSYGACPHGPCSVHLPRGL